MIGRWSAVLVLSVFAACVAVSGDPFVRADGAMRRGDLLGALRAYEAVPPTHAGYAIARAAVAELAHRLERSHAALLAGIVHRGEGRDHEALASLCQARSEWPELPMIDAWIAAVRERLAAAPTPDATQDGAADAPEPPDPVASTVAEESAGQIVASAGLDFGHADQQELFGAVAEDAVALGLVAVEVRLGAGELELAVIDLLELARRHPADARIHIRLARVLHQRALLRYGQGALTAALADWERVLTIQPENRIVKALLDAVRAEAASPSR